MGTVTPKKAAYQVGERKITKPKQWLKKFWVWAQKSVFDKDAQVYMAPNFKLDN